MNRDVSTKIGPYGNVVGTLCAGRVGSQEMFEKTKTYESGHMALKKKHENFWKSAKN